MPTADHVQPYYARNRKAWRNWLAKHHDTEKNVWLILCNKNSSKPGVAYEEAVEEALCFGWIDSTVRKWDEESRIQLFAKRKPRSNWSISNRERVKRLIAQGLMTESGQAMIDLAKKTGTWDALVDAQNSVIPDDLQKLFNKHKTAYKHFQAFSPSSKRMILEWIQTAKRPETRKQRIEETVALAGKNIKAYPSLR